MHMVHIQGHRCRGHLLHHKPTVVGQGYMYVHLSVIVGTMHMVHLQGQRQF